VTPDMMPVRISGSSTTFRDLQIESEDDSVYMYNNVCIRI